MFKFKGLLLYALMLLILAGCGTDEEEVKTIQLKAPETFTFDGEVLRWEDVEEADQYEIIINGTSYVVDTNQKEYDADDESFNVRAKALSSLEEYDNSEESDLHVFEYLDFVKNLRIDNGIVTWNNMPNVDAYQIEVNGVETVKTTENFFDDLDAGLSTTIRVLPIKEATETTTFKGRYGAEIMFTLLEAPILEFEHSSQTIIWDAIDGAQGYHLTMKHDDEIVLTESLGSSRVSYVYGFALPGQYEVRVQATFSGEAFNDSKYSLPIEVTRLDEVDEYYVETMPTNVTNVIFPPVDDAVNYEIKVDGVVQDITSNEYFEHTFPSSLNELEHTIEIIALGDNHKILDSPRPLTFSLVKLSMPRNINFNEGVVTWDDVERNSGYQIYLNGTIYKTQHPSFELPPLAEGEHKISFSALGNRQSIVDSNFTENHTFKRLAAPKNLEIDNNILSWERVSDAQGYHVRVGDQVIQSTTNNTYDISPSEIQSSTVITVIAVGNGGDILDSTPSNTLGVYRLERPQNLSISNSNLSWNSVPNADGYLVKLNDAIFRVSGTQFSWDNLDSGSYSVSVIALGDGKTYFDSSATNLSSDVRKLQEPNVEVTEDGIQWNFVSGAEGYELQFDSESILLDRNTDSYMPNFTEPKTFVIKVRAIGNEDLTVSSKFSEFEHTVQALNIPSGAPAMDIDKDGNQLILELHDEVTNAIGYEFVIGGVAQTSSTTTLIYDVTSPGEHVIQYRALGDNLFYTHSNYSGEKIINVLPAVSNIEFNLQPNDIYDVTWNGSSGAIGYRVVVIKRDIQGDIISEETHTISETNMMISKGDADTIEIRITARGNSVDTFDSSEVTKIN